MAECSSKVLSNEKNCNKEREAVYPIASLPVIQCTPTPTLSGRNYVSRDYISERNISTEFNGDFLLSEFVTPTPTPSVTPTFTPTPSITPSSTSLLPPGPSTTPTGTPPNTPMPTPTQTKAPEVIFELQIDIKVATRAKIAVNLLTSEFAVFHAVEGNFPTNPIFFNYTIRGGPQVVAEVITDFDVAWQEPRIKGTPPRGTRQVAFKNGVLEYNTNGTWNFDGINANYSVPHFKNYAYMNTIKDLARLHRYASVALYAPIVISTAAGGLAAGGVVAAAGSGLAASAGAALTNATVFTINTLAGTTATIGSTVAGATGAAGAAAASGVTAVATSSAFTQLASAAYGLVTNPVTLVIGVVLLILALFFTKPPPKRKIPQWSQVIGLPLPIAETARKTRLNSGAIPAYTKKGGIRLEQYPTKSNGFIAIVDCQNIVTTDPYQPSPTEDGFQFSLTFSEN